MSPPMVRRGRRYLVQSKTNFTIQYGSRVPYRMCAIVQTRHPGESRLSGLEVLSLLLLGIECHADNSSERFHTVPTLTLG